MKTRENIRSEYFHELEKLRENLKVTKSELISEKVRLNVLMEISIGLFNAKSFEDIGKTIDLALSKIISMSNSAIRTNIHQSLYILLNFAS